MLKPCSPTLNVMVSGGRRLDDNCEGEALMNGFRTLTRVRRALLLLSALCHVRIRECGCLWSRGRFSPESSHPDRKCPASRTLRNKFLLCISPLSRVLVIAAKTDEDTSSLPLHTRATAFSSNFINFYQSFPLLCNRASLLPPEEVRHTP